MKHCVLLKLASGADAEKVQHKIWKTCQKLGGMYEGTTSVPEDIRKKYEIGPSKCRYIWVPEESGT